MTDTVTRLMALADDYADWAMAKGQEHPAYLQTRQALQDELQKLFTPLSDDVILEKWMDGRVPVLNFAHEIEAMHGIGETK